MKRLMMLLAGTALMAGCSTVAISENGTLKGVDVKGADGKADRTLCVGNEGYFLFNTFPIFAGSMDWVAEKNGIDPWGLAWFRDDASLKSVTDAFYRYAEHENCDAVDVVVHNKTEYPIGITGIPALISNIFTTHEMFVTGVLKPRNK